MAASFCRRSFLNYKNCLFQTQRRTGYVVLIPETPEEVAHCNVDSTENLPDFSSLDEKKCKLLVNKFCQQYDLGAWELNELLLKERAGVIDIFKHVIEPLEVLSVPFLSCWGITKTLYFSNKKLISPTTFNPINERVVQIRNNKFNTESIYTACKTHLKEKGHECTEEQKRILKKFIWEGTLNGFELSVENKTILTKVSASLEMSIESYSNKYNISRSSFKQLIDDKNFVQDCPLDLLRNSSLNWNAPLEGPWIITLNPAVYSRFLEYCPSTEARKHIWLSYNQICSSRGERVSSAVTDFEGLRTKRQEIASLFGFQSYAHLAIKTKMAESLENVESVLSYLLDVAKSAQEKEINELEKFAYSHNHSSPLQLWDLTYWKRVYLKETLRLDEKVLKEFFPLNQVLLGLIALCEHLFGIEIIEQQHVEAWDSDVRYFRVLDPKTKSILGGFFLDPYAKLEKSVGETDSGWFVPMRPKSKFCSSAPLSSLIFSFNPPEEDKPSLLYFRDVTNLFQMFGEMLQYTLTCVNYSEVSGMSNIELDVAAVPQYFLNLWLLDRSTVESISGHYETGEPLPSDILDNFSQLQKCMYGTKLCRDIYYSNLDLALHLKKNSCMDIVKELWPKHLLFDLSPLDQHPFGFIDITHASLAASFYRRVWSSMIAADIFSAFVEAGFQNQEEISNLGKKFRSTFLAFGGGNDPKELFRTFRGRDPNPTSLLKLMNIYN